MPPNTKNITRAHNEPGKPSEISALRVSGKRNLDSKDISKAPKRMRVYSENQQNSENANNSTITSKTLTEKASKTKPVSISLSEMTEDIKYFHIPENTETGVYRAVARSEELSRSSTPTVSYPNSNQSYHLPIPPTPGNPKTTFKPPAENGAKSLISEKDMSEAWKIFKETEKNPAVTERKLYKPLPEKREPTPKPVESKKTENKSHSSKIVSEKVKINKGVQKNKK